MIVIIDEINSCGFDEQLLNSLLMGKGLDGKHPTHPGFMLIGTQNPATMSGRAAMSTALSRRLLTLNLPPYSTSEMIEIIEHQGLNKTEAKALVQAYNEHKEEEKNKPGTRSYTFRDLLHLVKKEQNNTYRNGVNRNCLFIHAAAKHSIRLSSAAANNLTKHVV